jgi:phosphonate transport system substrate-binding protein
MKSRKWAAFLAAIMILAACGNGDGGDDAAEGADADGAPRELDDDRDDAATDDVPEDWPDELVLTLQPAEDAGALIEDAEVLAGLLADRLGIPVLAEVPQDYAAVIEALGSGRVDIGGGFGPIDVARAMDQADAEPILQSERFGEFLYVSQWFTNDPETYCEDEPVEEVYEEDGDAYPMRFCNGVNELESAEEGPVGLEFLENAGNADISFVAEGSISGQVFPAFGLLEAGYDLDELDTEFAGGHPESVLRVYNGDSSVGVSYVDARQAVVGEFGDVGEQVVVFAWSAPIPNDGFVVRGDLPEDLKRAITDALRGIAGHEEDGQVLLDLYNVEGLRPADPDDFQNARDVDATLGEHLD